MAETINQYSKHHSDPPERVRISSRGLVIENGNVLLSHEVNTGVYMSPGGGLESGETLEECCVRELCEETGYIVKPLEHFITVNEYCFETMYVSNYFICERVGESVQALTETEIDHGITPEWVDLKKAVEIFGTYASKREDHASLYLREFTVLKKYLEKKNENNDV